MTGERLHGDDLTMVIGKRNLRDFAHVEVLVQIRNEALLFVAVEIAGQQDAAPALWP